MLDAAAASWRGVSARWFRELLARWTLIKYICRQKLPNRFLQVKDEYIFKYSEVDKPRSSTARLGASGGMFLLAVAVILQERLPPATLT